MCESGPYKPKYVHSVGRCIAHIYSRLPIREYTAHRHTEKDSRRRFISVYFYCLFFYVTFVRASVSRDFIAICFWFSTCWRKQCVGLKIRNEFINYFSKQKLLNLSMRTKEEKYFVDRRVWFRVWHFGSGRLSQLTKENLFGQKAHAVDCSRFVGNS